jgi:hypothetical protein
VTIRRLEVLQWVGLLAGLVFAMAQLVLGYGFSDAECGAGGAPWGIANDTWQITLMSVSTLVVLAAEAAAITVVVQTRHVGYSDAEPPIGRIRFLAIAAIPANACFLGIVLLSGIASIADVVCRQA